MKRFTSVFRLGSRLRRSHSHSQLLRLSATRHIVLRHRTLVSLRGERRTISAMRFPFRNTYVLDRTRETILFDCPIVTSGFPFTRLSAKRPSSKCAGVRVYRIMNTSHAANSESIPPDRRHTKVLSRLFNFRLMNKSRTPAPILFTGFRCFHSLKSARQKLNAHCRVSTIRRPRGRK